MTIPTPTNPDDPSDTSSTDANPQDHPHPKPSKLSKKSTTGPGTTLRTIPRACKKRITRFFNSLTNDVVLKYVKDWTKIRPSTPRQALNRWRFAYCTVHTPWERSCEQYDQIKHEDTTTPISKLEKLLSSSSGGMFNIKATGINGLHYQWNTNPLAFVPNADWQQWRNELMSKLPKLGPAKTSFAIEMLHPTTAQCICLDRHMLKAFGWTQVDQTVSIPQYQYYENYWITKSNEKNIPPVISRNIFWDQIQQQPDSLYWANYLIES